MTDMLDAGPNGFESTGPSTSEPIHKAQPYRDLLNLAHSHVIVFDPVSRTIIEINDTALRSLGYKRRELEGGPIDRLGASFGRKQLGDDLRGLLERGQSGVTRMRAIQRSDGSSYPLKVTYRRIDAEGKPVIAMVGLSINERIDIEEHGKRQLLLQERERSRLAADLHDTVAQSLVALLLDLRTETDAPSVDERQRVIESLKGVLDQVRGITNELRPPWLEDTGFAAAVRQYGNRLGSLGHFSFSSQLLGDLDGLPQGTKLHAFRIIQEALSNVLRHAEAKHVKVSVCYEGDELLIQVDDDGQGFEVGRFGRRIDDEPGFGLFGMQERTAWLGGTFSMRSAPGKGAHVQVRVPIKPKPDKHRLGLGMQQRLSDDALLSAAGGTTRSGRPGELNEVVSGPAHEN